MIAGPAYHDDKVVLTFRPETLQPERRRHARIRTARIVRVLNGGRDWLAGCRDISDGGMKLESACPAQLGDRVTVLFSPHVILHAKVVWLDDGAFGISLDREVDAMALLTTSALEARAAEDAAQRRAAVNARERTAARSTKRSFSPGLRVKVLGDEGQENTAFLRLTPNPAS